MNKKFLRIRNKNVNYSVNTLVDIFVYLARYGINCCGDNYLIFLRKNVDSFYSKCINSNFYKYHKMEKRKKKGKNIYGLKIIFCARQMSVK